MQTHRPQFGDDRTTPHVGRRAEAEEVASESPDPVTRAVYPQWLYHDKISSLQGLGGDAIDDMEFAALSGNTGPSVR